MWQAGRGLMRLGRLRSVKVGYGRLGPFGSGSVRSDWAGEARWVETWCEQVLFRRGVAGKELNAVMTQWVEGESQ